MKTSSRCANPRSSAYGEKVSFPLLSPLCVKLDPGTQKGMHSVLALKLGVTEVVSEPC
jgi:hypothetical protein